MFKVITIRPNRVKVTYYKDDSRLFSTIVGKYKDEHQEDVRQFLANSGQGDELAVKNRSGHETIITRTQYGHPID